MSDEAALLAAIRNHPEEDTPRLVYADWLDEHATTDAQRARAELIRAQCELAAGNADEPSDRREQLAARADELVKKYGREWVKDFSPNKTEKPFFARGFLWGLDTTIARCLNQRRRPPWHREPFVALDLTGTVTDAKKLIKSGWLNGVWSLDIDLSRQAGGDALCAELAASDCAVQLRELSLWNERFTDAGLHALAGGRFTELRELSFMGQFTAAGLEALLESPACVRLNDLTIGHRGPWQPDQQIVPGHKLADILAAAPCASHLRKLWLSGCGVGDKGLARLVSCGRFPNLYWLHLGHDYPEAAVGKALARPALPALREVMLGSCNVTDALVAALAKSPLMAQIEDIDLTLNNLTAASARALARSNRCGALKNLNVGFNDLGDAGIRALVASRKFPRLRTLHIDSNDVTDAGANAVLNSKWVAELAEVGLGYNQLSPAKRDECVRKFGSKVWFNTD